MKVCLIQPGYAVGIQYADFYFARLLELMDQCDASVDVIVCPEYCDVPVATANQAEHIDCIKRFNHRVFDKAKETAIRCQATVFINAACETETGYRNTTYAISKGGKVLGKYFKAHPAPSEYKSAAEGGNGLDTSYCTAKPVPYVLEIDNVRYGFLTCYDFYFYEDFIDLARQNVDVIIGCSHQRTDTPEALALIGQFLCYNTNAFLLRASVSMGEDSPVGGCSMVVSPKGEMLLDMRNRVGIATCEIDLKDKYFKPAGFGGKLQSHWQYVEAGREWSSKRK